LHHQDLTQIPPSLHRAFDRVWSVETSEDWIVICRLQTKSKKKVALTEAFDIAVKMRDQLMQHWNRPPVAGPQ
jgi:hypothetical protein